MTSPIKLTVLGCGPSGGVPLIGNYWGKCNPENPKNRRQCTSLLIEDGKHTFLIDTSPDLRQQLLDHNISWLDAVLYTHYHSDHAHGIDELRPMYFCSKRRAIPVYGTLDTITDLQNRFTYLFSEIDDPDKAQIYPKILETNIIKGNEFHLFDHHIRVFEQDHGHSSTTGFRFDHFAYSTDVVRLSNEAFEALEGVDIWFVDCLDRTPRPTHAHLDLTLSWIEKVKPKRAILIHMNQNLDYDTLKAELPSGVEPAYDGMVIKV